MHKYLLRRQQKAYKSSSLIFDFRLSFSVLYQWVEVLIPHYKESHIVRKWWKKRGERRTWKATLHLQLKATVGASNTVCPITQETMDTLVSDITFLKYVEAVCTTTAGWCLPTASNNNLTPTPVVPTFSG
jgi:hypothetical protein